MSRIGRALRRFIDRLARRIRGVARAGATRTPGMLIGLTVEEFTEALAASTPTPGGGSASAQAGAMAASLLRMMCDLTLGREAYRAHEAAVQGIKGRAESLRKDLLALVDRDAEAYDSVVHALRLPKGTPAELSERAAALGRANLFAIEAPMAIADACAVLMGLAGELAIKGNVNAVSDVGAAALLAYAGLRGAILSVRVNLKGVKDEAQALKIRDRVRRLEIDSEKLREDALTAVYGRTNGR
jgi:formiminotetrahydrofolate cyclodeaminase